MLFRDHLLEVNKTVHKTGHFPIPYSTIGEIIFLSKQNIGLPQFSCM